MKLLLIVAVVICSTAAWYVPDSKEVVDFTSFVIHEDAGENVEIIERGTRDVDAALEEDLEDVLEIDNVLVRNRRSSEESSEKKSRKKGGKKCKKGKKSKGKNKKRCDPDETSSSEGTNKEIDNQPSTGTSTGTGLHTSQRSTTSGRSANSGCCGQNATDGRNVAREKDATHGSDGSDKINEARRNKQQRQSMGSRARTNTHTGCNKSQNRCKGQREPNQTVENDQPTPQIVHQRNTQADSTVHVVPNQGTGCCKDNEGRNQKHQKGNGRVRGRGNGKGTFQQGNQGNWRGKDTVGKTEQQKGNGKGSVERGNQGNGRSEETKGKKWRNNGRGRGNGKGTE